MCVDRMGRNTTEEKGNVLVDVMRNGWKVRKDREALSHEELGFLSGLLPSFGHDLRFAFGEYAGGDILGPPFSLHQMYSKTVDIQPSNAQSKGFEKLVERDEVDELDPSLQQIGKRMREILKTIEGRCRMWAVRLLGLVLGKVWRLMFSSINVDASGIERVRESFAKAAEDGSAVMLLPTHRSHIDYLLMSYISFGFNLPIPHIASGDNLNIPLVGSLFLYSGAFFLRRSFRGDNLYKKVLYGYILRKLREGCPVEVFVEGGRTRTGMISKPKMGLIIMVVRFVRENKLKDVTLMPSSIDYEYTMETKGHVNQVLGSKKKPETIWGAISSSWKVLSGQSVHGGVYVNFASGISIREVIAQVDEEAASKRNGKYQHCVTEEDYVRAVTERIVGAQRNVSYVTGTGIVAAALLITPKPCSVDSLSSMVTAMVKLCKTRTSKRTICIPPEIEQTDLVSVIGESLQTLQPLLMQEDSGSETMARAKVRLQLRYTCGQLLPILVPYGIVAAAVEGLESGDWLHLGEVLERAQEIARMVRFSFPGSNLEENSLFAAVNGLVESRILLQNAGTTIRRRDDDLLHALALLVSPSISSFCLCMGAISSHLLDHGAITEDEIIAKTRERVTSLGDLAPSECLSSVEIKASISAALEFGFLAPAGQATSPRRPGSPKELLTPTSAGASSFRSSHLSLVSMASSRTIGSVGSEGDAMERKSNDSGGNDGSSPAESTSTTSRQKPSYEMTPSYATDSGALYFKKLEACAKHMSRRKVSPVQIPKNVLMPSKQTKSQNVMSLGLAIVASGVLFRLIRLWGQSKS
mmetsp:Transcript_19920/g.32786  ORF Transcript_19920/g.32786 Transcript_19920/m.32786 type:complete len:810 (+) Transcript_19920:180-2609(+)